MAEQGLQELSKESINVTKYEDTTMLWHDSILTILTEKGLHFFEFSHNVECFEKKKINFLQSIICHPKYSPASSLFTEKVMNKQLSNMNLTEMIVDHALWPHNSQLLHESSSIIDFRWSPSGIINNNGSAVAILTNVGVVEIYEQNIFKWRCAVEISTMLGDELLIHTKQPENVDELREIVYALSTTAICWCPEINSDNSGYFVTAQKNGNLLFWLVECSCSNITAKLLTSIQSETTEIVSMLWIPIYGGKFYLICSNSLGQIVSMHCQIQFESIYILESIMLWPLEDKMICKYLNLLEINGYLYLICNKHRHLVVLMLDLECKVLEKLIKNVNDHRITCITKASNEIYVTTVNCKIYTLSLTNTGNDLYMNLNPVEIQGLSPTHELHSISYSPNKTLCAITIIDRKTNSRKDPMKIEIVLTSKETVASLFDVLMKNPTKLLTNYWDVIEVLRYITLKTREAPPVDYEKLYELGTTDIYTLKVYLILCTLCGVLKKLFKLPHDFKLPEVSADIIKEEILVAHADKLLRKHLKKMEEQEKLEDTELDYMFGAKNFLEYYFEKMNMNSLHDVIDSKTLNVLGKRSNFICQCCDEQVKGFSCKNKHLNMFCGLTFTPIEVDSYLICKWCNFTVRRELLAENPICLFCDIRLVLVDD